MHSDDIEILNRKIILDLDGENLLVNPAKTTGFEFHNQINLYANKAGKYTIGPYKLKIGNCELVSNTIDIEVHEKPKIDSPEFSNSESKIFIKVSDQKEFFITSNFEFDLNNSIQNQGFVIKKGRSSVEKSLVAGVMKTTNNYSFKIIAKKPGIYKITKDYFNFLPTNLDIKELELDIKP